MRRNGLRASPHICLFCAHRLSTSSSAARSIAAASASATPGLSSTATSPRRPRLAQRRALHISAPLGQSSGSGAAAAAAESQDGNAGQSNAGQSGGGEGQGPVPASPGPAPTMRVNARMQQARDRRLMLARQEEERRKVEEEKRKAEEAVAEAQRLKHARMREEKRKAAEEKRRAEEAKAEAERLRILRERQERARVKREQEETEREARTEAQARQGRKRQEDQTEQQERERSRQLRAKEQSDRQTQAARERAEQAAQERAKQANAHDKMQAQAQAWADEQKRQELKKQAQAEARAKWERERRELEQQAQAQLQDQDQDQDQGQVQSPVDRHEQQPETQPQAHVHQPQTEPPQQMTTSPPFRAASPPAGVRISSAAMQAKQKLMERRRVEEQQARERQEKEAREAAAREQEEEKARAAERAEAHAKAEARLLREREAETKRQEAVQRQAEAQRAREQARQQALDQERARDQERLQAQQSAQVQRPVEPPRPAQPMQSSQQPPSVQQPAQDAFGAGLRGPPSDSLARMKARTEAMRAQAQDQKPLQAAAEAPQPAPTQQPEPFNPRRVGGTIGPTDRLAQRKEALLAERLKRNEALMAEQVKRNKADKAQQAKMQSHLPAVQSLPWETDVYTAPNLDRSFAREEPRQRFTIGRPGAARRSFQEDEDPGPGDAFDRAGFGRNSYHDQRYRVNVRDRSQVAVRDDPFDANVASSWKHLKPRNGRAMQEQVYRPLADNGPLDRYPEENVRARDSQFEQPQQRGHVPLTRNAPQRESRYQNDAAVSRGQVERDDFGEVPSSAQPSPARPAPAFNAFESQKPGRSSRRSSRFEDYDRDADATVAALDRNKRTNRMMSKSRELDDWEADDRKERKAERKRQRELEGRQAPAAPKPLHLPDFITVSNLANMMRVRADNVVRKMEDLGFEDIQMDDVLTSENSGLVAMEYNFEPITDQITEQDDIVAAPLPEDQSDWPQRPPVVTIMGHVDHGKTTILDFLRKSSVAAGEFGGITQHIGAFSVGLSSGKTITFLDTPGHAAFLNMRQRGANVTDIVVLVVAADDSVKPQTIEAIKHAQGAGVPIVVAINKIDKPEANPDIVKADLARHEITVEDFGGDTQVVEVSGKTGQGMSDLEETITTLSEILDHRATASGPVEGWVLEAQTKLSGRAATVLVRRGTLRRGDFIVAGTTYARVRTIKNEAGIEVDEVTPGMPAEIDGWRGEPEAGDEVLQAPSEQRAANVVHLRERRLESGRLLRDMEAIHEYRRLVEQKREREEAAAQAAERAEKAGEDAEAARAAALREAAAGDKQESGLTQVPFIIKADVSGSAEAVENYIASVGNNEVAPRVLRTGVGIVSEFDVEHAAVAQGHVIAFNTTITPDVRRLAELKGVRLLESNIIYRVVEVVKDVLSEKLAPLVTQRVTGEATVLQVFSIGVGGKRKMNVAGSRVTNGIVERSRRVRVLRGEEKLFDGHMSSLKQVKKEVSEMRKGSECGIGFDGWELFQPGDTIQCYDEKSEKRYL